VPHPVPMVLLLEMRAELAPCRKLSANTKVAGELS
jgi:hypothetical protein